MKDIDVYGLSHAIMDVLLHISAGDFLKLGYAPGSRTLVSSNEQRAFLERYQSHKKSYVSGGSVANSIIAVSQLGGSAGLSYCVGDDSFGQIYNDELKRVGILTPPNTTVSGDTATCVILITPDGERTMRTHLGVAAALGEEHLNCDAISRAQWLLIEGYSLSNGSRGMPMLRHAIATARSAGTSIALTLSDTFIVREFRRELEELLDDVDLVFMNKAEACEFAGEPDAEAAFDQISKRIPSAVMTAGSSGAFIHVGDSRLLSPAFPCTPIDLTGAGDMFAGAFLFGLCRGLPVGTCARGASYLAMHVVSQIGARLGDRAPGLWEKALALGSNSAD